MLDINKYYPIISNNINSFEFKCKRSSSLAEYLSQTAYCLVMQEENSHLAAG